MEFGREHHCPQFLNQKGQITITTTKTPNTKQVDDEKFRVTTTNSIFKRINKQWKLASVPIND